jgi:hypothetical protein
MRRFIIAILIGGLALSAPALAQEPKERAIPFEGAEVFCHILFHEGLQPIQSLDALAADHKDTLLIVFGKMERMNDIRLATGGLHRFLEQGGSLLIVSDHYHLFGSLHVGIDGAKITQPPANAYRSQSDCPWLPSTARDDHPLFRGLHRGIATNRPSFITTNAGKPASKKGGLSNPGPDGSVKALLAFPRDAKRGDDANGNGLTYMMGSPENALPHGRVLLIAGQGMFMNGMMLQTDEKNRDNFDNDNLEFAVNAIRWLREARGGAARSRALLMVDGTIVTDFNMNLSPSSGALPTPRIPIPPVKVLNRLIHGLEEDRAKARGKDKLAGDTFGRVVGVLLALATFGLLLYAAKKFLEGRVQRETGVPRMVGAAPPLGPGLRRGQQRQLAFYQQADSAKESKQLVSAWLKAEFGVQPEQWPADAVAAFQASGFVWTRWPLQRQADDVLRIVRGAGLVPVSRGQFSRLVETLANLSEARVNGRLALLVDGKNVRQVGG